MKTAAVAILTILLSFTGFAQQTVNKTIYFDHDRYELTQEAMTILDDCLQVLKAKINTGATITGHTDSDGSDRYNMVLSKKRADAVFDYFTSKGISKDRVRLMFVGESSPVTDNSTDEHKGLNRRVEITINEGVAISPLNGKTGKPEGNFRIEKQAQVFAIDPGRDTILHCKEGTLIRIDANSLVTISKGKPVTGTVTISVTEYYSISDMILAGLSTTSDGDLLETAGMVNITAMAGDEDLKLKVGKSVEISFPTEKKESDMQLFTGSWDDTNIINWDVQSLPDEIFNVVEEMPEFIEGNLFTYLQNNLTYPKSAVEMGVQGTVYLTFIVTDKGKVINPRILRGVMPDLDEEALRVLRNMPDWKPGRQRGKNVNVQYNMPIKFTLDGGGSVSFAEGGKYYRERFENTYTDTAVQQAGSDTILYYVLSSTQLNWINCDRFMFISKPTDYIVKLDKDAEYLGIIFDKYSSIMEVMPKEGIYRFTSVPAGEDITIVAMKRIDNILHLSVKKSNTSLKTENNLTFQPVTMDLLKAEMEKLGKLR